MILRILNLVVIGLLVLAAADVYRIKFDATVQAERLAKLRSEVRREGDRIAALRAQWGALDNPARIEPLAKRFLNLRPVAPIQFDALDHLPARPLQSAPPGSSDPIGGIIEHLDDPAAITGGVRKGVSRGAPAKNLSSAVPPDKSGATNR
jgi:hypothetical protein